MNFKESRAIYLQIADRICDESCWDNMKKRGVFLQSGNMHLL